MNAKAHFWEEIDAMEAQEDTFKFLKGRIAVFESTTYPYDDKYIYI